MTRPEIADLLNGGPLPCEGFFARPAYAKVFQAVGQERRNISNRIERARAKNPANPSLARAELLLAKFDVHLWVCLHEWEPVFGRAN